MARFNKKTVSKYEKTVTNVAGGASFKESPKMEFASTLLTSFLSNTYYEDADKRIDRIADLIGKIEDKKFCAKAAIYARKVFGMRSVSHMVAGELAKHVKGEVWMRPFIQKVVHRPDDMIEILSYYMGKYGKPIPNSLKRRCVWNFKRDKKSGKWVKTTRRATPNEAGLHLALKHFDAYQLAKYRAARKDISLVDVINIIHPVGTEKNAEALKMLVNDELRSTETWEAKMSNIGQADASEEEKAQAKSETWHQMIKSRKLGYFALLRNLRNIIDQAPEAVEDACKMLVDERLIQKSLVLPFRYTSAMDAVGAIRGTKSRRVMVAIDDAIEVACKNVPKFEGETLVVVDCSGSMIGKPSQIASLFAGVMAKSNQCDLMVFNERAKYITYNPKDSVSTIAKLICYATAGTNFNAIFQTANKKYDRIVILSDMQGWMVNTDRYGWGLGQEGGAPTQSFKTYKAKYNAKPKVYSFNLNDYGTLMFPEEDVLCVAGFSQKVFDLMKLFETDSNAMINEIEKVEI